MLDLTPFAIILIHIWAMAIAVLLVRKTWRMWGEVKWERKRNLQLWESRIKALIEVQDALRMTETCEDTGENSRVVKHLKTARDELKNNPHRST